MLKKLDIPAHPQLDTPAAVGDVTVRVNRDLLCTRCDHRIHAFHAQEMLDGVVAVICPRCHTVAFQIDVAPIEDENEV